MQEYTTLNPVEAEQEWEFKREGPEPFALILIQFD